MSKVDIEDSEYRSNFRLQGKTMSERKHHSSHDSNEAERNEKVKVESIAMQQQSLQQQVQQPNESVNMWGLRGLPTQPSGGNDDLPEGEMMEMEGVTQEERISWLQNQISKFNKCRYVIGGIVNNKHVQQIVVILISINAIMMGIGTFNFVTNNDSVDSAFEKTDQAFLIVFTIEMGMQFIYHGWRLLLDGWLVFDLFIILLSWSFSSVQIIRAFRIFRALRLITRIKVMKNLMLALFGVMPRMMAIFVLLMLIMYIFSVMFTQLFKDLYPTHLSANYFGQMDETLFTLFQIMTMDEWSSITREVMAVPGYSWAWIPFIVFVVITGFIVVNLIIAVICDAISALHDDDKAKLLGMYDENDVSTDNDESQGSPSSMMDTHEHMESLEQQVEELSRIQEQTLQTLEHLTLQLQLKKMKQVETDSSDNS